MQLYGCDTTAIKMLIISDRIKKGSAMSIYYKSSPIVNRKYFNNRRRKYVTYNHHNKFNINVTTPDFPLGVQKQNKIEVSTKLNCINSL